jgi:hypothetical protein
MFRSDYVSSAEEHDGITDRPIVPHALFKDNLGVIGAIKLGHCNKLYSKMPTRRDSGVFDALAYLGTSCHQYAFKETILK